MCWLSLIFQHCKVSDFLPHMQEILQFICKQIRKLYMLYNIRLWAYIVRYENTSPSPSTYTEHTILCLHQAYLNHLQRSMRALQTVAHQLASRSRCLRDRISLPPPCADAAGNIRPLPIFFLKIFYTIFVVIFYVSYYGYNVKHYSLSDILFIGLRLFDWWERC